MKLTKLFALVLACALAAGVLAGCGSSAASESAPSKQAEASAEGLLPEGDETFTDVATAFERCLGWGEGTAGTSLKSVLAASDLLAWAEQNSVAGRKETAQGLVEEWYKGLSDTQQEGLAEAWPLIEADADTLLDDKNSMSGRVEDAGLTLDTLPGCSQKNWDALRAILDKIVPETQGEK